MPELQTLTAPGLAAIVDFGVAEQAPGDRGGCARYAVHCDLPLQTLEQYASAGLRWDEALSLLDRLGQTLVAAHRQQVVLRPEAAAIVMTGREPRILPNVDHARFTSLVSHARVWICPPSWGRARPGGDNPFKRTPEVARAGDQYRLATLAHYLLAGTWPWSDRDWEGVYSWGFSSAEDVPNLPEPVAAVLQRGLAAEPEDRFASVEEFLSTLHAARPDPTRQTWPELDEPARELVKAVVPGSPASCNR
jgi:hypothetical protein